MIPLEYVIQNNPEVPGIAFPLAANQPDSTEHGSEEGELIARDAHTHALFRDDNFVVYYHIWKKQPGELQCSINQAFSKRKRWEGGMESLNYSICRQGQMGS